VKLAKSCSFPRLYNKKLSISKEISKNCKFSPFKDKEMKIKFWGTRGSTPVPGKDTIIYR